MGRGGLDLVADALVGILEDLGQDVLVAGQSPVIRTGVTLGEAVELVGLFL